MLNQLQSLHFITHQPSNPGSAKGNRMAIGKAFFHGFRKLQYPVNEPEQLQLVMESFYPLGISSHRR